jgi:hypothetical protein
MAPEPPEDPEEWTDEQWLEFLEAGDAEAPSRPAREPSAPVRGGAVGAVLGAAMKGLHDALYGPNDDEVVAVAPGREPDDDDMQLHLDEEQPHRSWVRLQRPSPDTEDGAADDADRA